ncbi:putative gustatory receptor 39b [Anastrepha obliqua]|uniref:putative gustatory receptor 39b n=1 Tax=Anastrepha obliqua TaxID=95512 RepID=UPI00240A2977|nr:putative gustatory receptor 39b [Anastrepha obliqua]
MEQKFQIWFRLCIFFGIYVLPPNRNYSTNRTSNFILTQSRKPSHCFAMSSKSIFMLQRLYISILTLMICALYVHGLPRQNVSPTLQLTWVATVILFSCQVLTNLLILMEAIWRRSQHAAFLMLLEEIEVSFKLRLRQDVQKLTLLRSLQCLIGCFAALSLVGFLLFMVTSVWLNYIGYFWHGLWSILTVRVRVIQLLVYVRILRHYLECLCVKLRQIVAYRMAPEQRMLDINYEKLESLEYLLAIKETYGLIFRAFQLLNYFAGWSFLSIVICYMFDISCNIYWTLMSLDGFPNRRYFYIAGPVSLLPLITIIWHLCYLCDKCKELARNIGCLLCRLKIMSTAKSMVPYRLVLHQFSTQLQLQRIEVTAQNFFALELRLLVTGITATATNLVVLMQFLMLWLEWAGGNVLRTGTLKIVGWFNSTI